MKITWILFALWICLPLSQAGSCPEACADICGTEKSCCPAKGQRCGPVYLERGKPTGSSRFSKEGPRLR